MVTNANFLQSQSAFFFFLEAKKKLAFESSLDRLSSLDY